MSPTRAISGARPAKAVRVPRLWLTLGATTYAVRLLNGADGRAYRLRKPDGTTYDVAEGRHGPSCDCPDFIYRRDGLDPDGCKHVQALCELGLIAPPEPILGAGGGRDRYAI